MKPVLVLRHVPHETMGSFEAILAGAGLEFRYVDLFAAAPTSLELQEAAAMVVLGGPMNVDEVQRYPFLKPEIAWIQRAVQMDLPLLGICLGSQLLAKALGARVYANGVKEIGWYQLELTPEASRDRLFADCGPTETVFQWHGDTFDLPTGAVHLAQSELCKHQAFRHGPCAYGLQFHIEMTPELIDSWLEESGNRQELTGLDCVDPRAIRAQTPHCLPAMDALGQRVLARFAAMGTQRA